MEAEITSICIVAPSYAVADVGEAGIFDGVRYFPIRWVKAKTNDCCYNVRGRFPIIAGESIYAKLTGTVVDASVSLTVLGFSTRV